MVGAVDLLINGEGALGVGERPRQIALGLQDRADVVGPDGNGGMVGAVDLLSDGERAPQ